MRRGVALLILLLTASVCYAAPGGNDGEGGNGGAGGNGGSMDNQPGGAGLPGHNGQRGMNGCPGGTAPSQDGRFYLPGTHEQCNPAHPKSHPKRHHTVSSGQMERI